MVVPLDQLKSNVTSLHGGAGVDWLHRLPDIIAECEREWAITASQPFPNLSYNYAAPALGRGGANLVLKIGRPSPAFRAETEALRWFDGRGSVRLLAYDADLGAMLLERLSPGEPLSRLSCDQQATSAAAQVMQQLWRPAPPLSGFPTIENWAAGLQRLRQRFEGETGPLPRGLVERAETLFAELIASMDAPVLLHGDLHHDNILSAERQSWLAIDPQGVIGEPAYEVGALLRNVAPQFLAGARLSSLLRRRIAQFADELGFDRERLRNWGLAQAVLSAWWCIEDHGEGWEWPVACAEALAAAMDLT